MITFMCGPLRLPKGIPDLSSDADPCCEGRALHGPRGCTCWVEVFSLPGQADPRPGPPGPPVPLRPCGDCAYGHDSPEKRGEPGYAADAGDLERLAAERIPFYCHAGVRYLIGYVHPESGRSWSPQLGDYRPPVIAGVPYQADGQPAVLCAGWLLRAAVLDRQRDEAGRQDHLFRIEEEEPGD